MKNKKMIRVAAAPLSLSGLLTGQLKFMSNYFDIIGVASKGVNNEIKLVAKSEEVPVYAVEINRNISPFRDLVSLWQLYFLFLKEKPFIVHSLTPKAGLLSMIAAYFARVPHRLHTFTGLIFPSKKGVLQKILIITDRILCFCATRVYPEGKGVKHDLIKFKITQKPLKVIANGNVNGINLNYFNPLKYDTTFINNFKNDFNILQNDFVFIFVGRLVTDKGVNELVAAFEKLNKQYSNIKLLLVGTYESNLDPLNNLTLKSIVKNKNIIELGWVDDVRPYFAISDVLTFPSYREGFPNVVLQAGAMGLPSIVTNISGCNEIIIPDENGVIIPVKDEYALLKAMELFSKGKKEISPVRCRDLILSRYEQGMVWKAILEEYNQLE